jgi:hypothetical protein
MTLRKWLVPSFALVSISSFAAPAFGDACSDLANLKLHDVTSIAATSVPANTFKPPGLPAPVSVDFCRVQIVVAPRIDIEVWLPLPSAWNHRYEAQGGGGYAGVISYGALAAAVVGDAVVGASAAASTDTGHPAAGTANGQGGANGAQGGGGFALNTADHTLNEGLIEDFAERSEHEMTLKAKEVIRAYYGEKPLFSYWNGCSTGGRQGWMEAQRHANDYDGILAGAPAFNWDRFIPAELWPELAQLLDNGGPVSQAKLAAVNTAAIKACDAADGAADGVIADPRECHFSPASLVCGLPTAPTDGTCLSESEARAVSEIWRGPRGVHGEFLWYGLEPATSFAGLANSNGSGFRPFVITTDHWRLWIMQNPSFDWTTLNVSSFEAGFRLSQIKFNQVIGTDDPDLAEFRAHGGKMITYHGWTDQLIFPRGSIDYYNRVVARNGGLHRVREFDRLFMVAGMNHCAGGPGATNFGQSGVTPVALDAAHDARHALRLWVEQGTPPDRFIATTDASHPAQNPTHPGPFARPVCPYPEEVGYVGGDPDEAGSFACVWPQDGRNDTKDRGSRW